MSYPISTVMGAGAPEIQLLYGDAGRRPGRRIHSTLEHPKDYEITFSPERYDGGAVTMRLDNGRIVRRHDGFRMVARMKWEGLTAANFLEIMVAHARAGATLMFTPHNDVDFSVEVTPTSEWMAAYTGGLYVGHSPELVLESVGLVLVPPRTLGSGTALAGVTGNYGAMPF